MCIAIVQKAGATIDEETLRRCYRANRDGAGLAYVKGNNIITKKGLFSETELVAAYKEAMAAKDADSPMLIHCRIATKGKVVADNCHPFKVKGGVMIHNGSLWGGTRQDDKSDTRELAEIQHNNFHRANIKAKIKEIGDLVGAWNKLAFLYRNKEYLIINEHSSGTEWKDDVWFSNKNWANNYTYNDTNYNLGGGRYNFID